MTHSLEYYREQRERALEMAKADVDQAGWFRLAEEWQKLMEAVNAETGEPQPEKSKYFVLDS